MGPTGNGMNTEILLNIPGLLVTAVVAEDGETLISKVLGWWEPWQSGRPRPQRPEIAEMQTRWGELSSPHLSPAMHMRGGAWFRTPATALSFSISAPPIVRFVCCLYCVCCVVYKCVVYVWHHVVYKYVPCMRMLCVHRGSFCA